MPVPLITPWNYNAPIVDPRLVEAFNSQGRIPVTQDMLKASIDFIIWLQQAYNAGASGNDVAILEALNEGAGDNSALRDATEALDLIGSQIEPPADRSRQIRALSLSQETQPATPSDLTRRVVALEQSLAAIDLPRDVQRQLRDLAKSIETQGSSSSSTKAPISATVLGSNANRQLIAAPLANTKVWIGSAGNLPVAQTVSGDATLAANGALTLQTVNANGGTWGDGTHVGQFTVSGKGLITAAASVAITGAAPTGAAGGDLSGTYPNPTVAQVNGAVVPTSASLVGTNGSKQLIAAANPSVTSLTLTPSTIAALPGSPTKGQIASVNNALAPALGSPVAGTGTAFAAVCWNGAQWTVFSI